MLDFVLRNEPWALVFEFHELGRSFAWAFGNGHGLNRRVLKTFRGRREREYPGFVRRNLGSNAHNGIRNDYFYSVAFVLPHFQKNHRKTASGDEFVRGREKLKVEN